MRNEGRKLAVTIGLDMYQSLPRLAGAMRGAEAMANVLRRGYRFEVATLFNEQATRGAINRELDRLKAADRAIVYYAGRVLDDGSLAAYSTDPHVHATAIDLMRLIRMLDALPIPHLIVILDAALGPPAELETLRVRESRSAEPLEARSRLILGAGLSAWGSRERWGDDDATPFTAQILHGLRGDAADADGVITAETLAAYVLEELSRNSKGRESGWAGQLPGAEGDWLLQEVAPLRLPREITEGLRSGFPSARYRSVAEIAKLIDIGDAVVAGLAVDLLREVAAENDSANTRRMAVDELLVRAIDPDAEALPALRQPPPPRPGVEPPSPSNAAPPPMPGDQRANWIVLAVMIGVGATVLFIIWHFS